MKMLYLIFFLLPLTSFAEFESISTQDGSIPISIVSQSEAKQIHDTFAKNPLIPFAYAFDGCYAKAHYMVQQLEMKNILAGKIFIRDYYGQKQFSLKIENLQLSFQTPYKGRVYFDWHVAIFLLVKDYLENTNISVIDPTFFNRPIFLKEWLATIGHNLTFETDYNYYLKNRFSYSFPNDYDVKKTKFENDDNRDMKRIFEEQLWAIQQKLELGF